MLITPSKEQSIKNQTVPLERPTISSLPSTHTASHEVMLTSVQVDCDIWQHTQNLLRHLWQQNWPSLRQLIQNQMSSSASMNEPVSFTREAMATHLFQWLGQWHAWEQTLQTGSMNPWLKQCDLQETEQITEEFARELHLIAAASQGKIEEAPTGQRLILLPLWHGNALDLLYITIEEETSSETTVEYIRRYHFHLEVMLHQIGHVDLTGTWLQSLAQKQLTLKLHVNPPLQKTTTLAVKTVFVELCGALGIKGTLD